MASVLEIYYLTIVSIVSVIGILGSLFIAAVNLLDWAKVRSLNTCDVILLALGISCACYQCTLVSQTFVYLTWVEIRNTSYLVIIQLKIWTNFSSFWLTACLCIFYCVKIVDLNHPFFMWIKLRISKVVPWLILGSLVGSLVLSIPVYWSSYSTICLYKEANSVDNATVPCRELTLKHGYNVPVHVLGFCVPLLLAVASITLLLASLHRHTQRMKENMSEFSQPKLEAHHKAARMVGSLLLIYCLLILVLCEMMSKVSQIWVNRIIWFFITCSTPAQSVILILGNAKLKQALWKVLTCGRKPGVHQGTM